MQIYCRQCGTPIKAKNVNLDNMMAKCDNCHAVFSFADMYADVHPKASKTQSPRHIPKPEGISIMHTDDALIIERKWNNYGHTRFTLISVVFNSAWWFFLPSLSGILSIIALPISILVFASFMYALIGLMNTMSLRVTNTSLEVTHYPIDLFSKSIATKDMDRLDVGSPFDGFSITTHRLYVKLFNGETISLFTTINDADDTDYIKQEIDNFLGLDA